MARSVSNELQHLEGQAVEGHLPSLLPASPRPGQGIEWEINRKLQTSLDVGHIIQLFFTEIQRELGCKNISYTNPAAELSIEIGNKARHSCNYQLKIGDDSLGHLKFTDSKRFTEAALHRVEDLLCLLVYPLRNALLYKSAIEQAMRDPLTGVLNRAAMDTILDKEIDIAQRHNNPLSLLVLDIDHFKHINDNFGHTMGDNALKSLVKRICECIRSSDILFRYGGEEFTLILSNTHKEGAMLLAERIRKSIENMVYLHKDGSLCFTVSLGVAALDGYESPEKLFNRADAALFNAKDAGRNCVFLAE